MFVKKIGQILNYYFIFEKFNIVVKKIGIIYFMNIKLYIFKFFDVLYLKVFLELCYIKEVWGD